MHLAVHGRHKDVVAVLLANGADVNARDGLGHSPFYIAKIYDLRDLMELLRRYGGHE